MGPGIAVAFFCIHQATFGLYNSSVFASNHKGMEMISATHRLGFFREQVLTSRNVRPHPVTDFWCGGLNYQIEHHLFPTLPRNQLGDARLLVQKFCADQGIPYTQTSLAGSYFETFRHLHRTSSSLRHGGQLAQAAAE
jgi:fatty acid desaturase